MNLKKARISSIHNEKVIVVFDEDQLISDELLLLGSEYIKPQINDQVLCLIPNIGDGLCLSKYLLRDQVIDDGIYKKHMGKDVWITVDELGKLIIDASSIEVNSNIVINGSVDIQGSLTVNGKVLV